MLSSVMASYSRWLTHSLGFLKLILGNRGLRLGISIHFNHNLVVCAGLNESAVVRRVFFTGGGGASKMAAEAIGGGSEQKIQAFQPSLR